MKIFKWFLLIAIFIMVLLPIALFAADQLGNVEQGIVNIILKYLEQYRGVLEILVGISILITERWLGKTDKVKAGSSLELVENIAKHIIKKKG